MPQPAIVILGATSAMGHAYARRCAGKGAALLLVGRNEAMMRDNAADLLARGASQVAVEVSDLADTQSAAIRWKQWIDKIGGQFDQVLLAYGSLGEQAKAQADPVETQSILTTNFTSAAVWLGLAAETIGQGRDKHIIAIGSVAGDRGRQSNYVYGAAKAGLEVFVEGLAHRLASSKVHVLLVKPGFVDTPMTAHLPKGGPLWSTPERVAEDIEKAVTRRRAVLYTPWFWRIIMTIITSVPRMIFHKTKL